MNPREELAALLEERTLSMWERRKRRMQRIPMHVVVLGLEEARKGDPLTLGEFIAASFGFLPEEYSDS